MMTAPAANRQGLTDYATSQRIELADAANSRRCGNLLAEHHPEIAASTFDVMGGCAIFAGVGSPITQAIGLGMSGAVSDEDMYRMEQFFESRGARTEVETSPHSHASLRDAYDRRGYRLLEWTNVLCQRLDSAGLDVEPPPGVEIRRARLDQADLLASLLVQGFAAELSQEMMLQLGVMGAALFRASAAGFIAYVDGHPAGGGNVFVHNGVAGAMGAATIPEFRRRGVQTALLNARLDYARSQGCDLAYTITGPGSGSQRNAERTGFEVVYTRSKMFKSP